MRGDQQSERDEQNAKQPRGERRSDGVDLARHATQISHPKRHQAGESVADGQKRHANQHQDVGVEI